MTQVKKKKILLLSDDLRMHSGIATVSREIVLNTVKEFDWVQLGAAVNHPDHGKVFDLSQDTASMNLPGVENPNVKIYAHTGYGNPDVLRELIQVEKPDAILHFTDPRQWGWLYAMEHEIRQICPLMFYTIWDDTPYPRWNRPFYESCDLLMCISKQTHNIVKQVLKDKDYKGWQVTYVPHGINHKQFFPIDELHPEWQDYLNFSNPIRKSADFVIFYNARNIRRKHTSDLVVAYKTFCDKLTKEQAARCLLLLHTDPVDENGTDLLAVIKEMCPMYPISFTHTRVITVKELNWYYNLSDIGVNIASNEGFGLGTAESIMAGTPVVVNVTGGLQDQCGFMKEDGTFLTETDYTDAFQTNADKVYLEHGRWAEPVFPAVRTLQGSIPTPYIFDDIACFKDVANAFEIWYNVDHKTREACGLEGRNTFMTPEVGLSAESMGNRMIVDINTMFMNWKPRKSFELIKVK